MGYNQTGDISTLDGTSLKLVDKFTYQGSSVSSTEKDIDTRLTIAWTAIDRLSIIWKSDLDIIGPYGVILCCYSKWCSCFLKVSLSSSFLGLFVRDCFNLSLEISIYFFLPLLFPSFCCLRYPYSFLFFPFCFLVFVVWDIHIVFFFPFCFLVFVAWDIHIVFFFPFCFLVFVVWDIHIVFSSSSVS